MPFILHKPCRVHGAFHALIKKLYKLISLNIHIPLAVLPRKFKENEFLPIALRWKERTEDQLKEDQRLKPVSWVGNQRDYKGRWARANSILKD